MAKSLGKKSIFCCLELIEIWFLVSAISVKMVELSSFLICSFLIYIKESIFFFLPPAISNETWFSLEKVY